MQAFFCLNIFVDPFKDFFKLGTNKRHRKPMIGGTDLQRKHVNVVAAKYKSDNTKNHKIETLKKQPGKFICDQKDLNYIQTNFLHNRMPGRHEFKMLGGKLGIKFYNDQKSGNWVIEKQ